MKYFISILLFIPFGLKAQWVQNPDTVDHPSLAEYCNLVYKASTHQAYHILNVVPQLMTHQPSYVAEIEGGPHDMMAISPIAAGNLYVSGSVLGTSLGDFSHVTTDSAGNALPPVTYMLCTAVSNGSNWINMIVTNDSTTGRQVGMIGQLGMGIHGNGTNTTTSQTTFVWATFPNNTHILKICGQYCIWALDSKGHVWSWGGANNKAMLQRGTSPTVSYTLPDTIVLPAGRHAVDIANEGDFGVILLDNGHILGGGDQPKYWGGSSASTSNTPQDFTAFLTSSVGVDPATGQSFVPAKVFNSAGALHYIGVDSTLVSSGDNICGEIGNGQMFPMNTYTNSPAPTGGTPQPYAFNNGLGQDLVAAPVRVCPGSHNWVCGYMGPSNCWNAAFVNNKGETWTWGRGKSMQTMNNRASCNYVAGGLNGTYPDMINNPYPIQIFPFNITSGTLVLSQCFYCIANPGATSCSQGTGCYNGGLVAPIVNSTKQILPTGTTSTTITPSVTYASGSKELFNYVVPVSGSAIMPFNTGTSITISGLSNGDTVIVKDTATDIMSKTGIGFDTVIVLNNSVQVAVPYRAVSKRIDTIQRHTLLLTDANYQTIDTLALPENTSGVFNLGYFSYDAVNRATGIAQQTVYLSRIGQTYGAPWVYYLSPYVRMGAGNTNPVGMSNYSITTINGLPVVRVSGNSQYPILWTVEKDSKFSPL